MMVILGLMMFLDKTPKVQSMKKIERLDLIKIEKVYSAKDTIKRMKQQPSTEENICTTYIK